MSELKHSTILLVEDDTTDAEITLRSFQAGNITNDFLVAHDGPTALSILKREGMYRDGVCPDLVLLDIHLPGMTGLEVLQYIKEDRNLDHVSVIMVTGSERDEDVIKALDLGAKGYLVKPANLLQLSEIVSCADNMGLSIVVKPQSE